MKQMSNQTLADVVRYLSLFAQTPCDPRDYAGMNARRRARVIAAKLEKVKEGKA